MQPGPVTNTFHTSVGIGASHLRLVSALTPFSFVALPAVPSPVPSQQFLFLVLVEFVGEELMHLSRMCLRASRLFQKMTPNSQVYC